MKDFDQRVNGVFQILTPLSYLTRLLLFLRAGPKLTGQTGQIIEQMNQIVNERFLKRFMHKIIAIFQEFIVQGVEQPLIHTLTIPDGSKLVFDVSEMIDLIPAYALSDCF